ncbi:NRDE family protein [Aestuariicella hydrocarbonica]|uniref:NRDE family protein n=2 Tax=Pseudomaricurvus hydrocarbonicus TaxID=1470433 RepID=A0A9E5JXU8_9GAMM|nr:NRDE family protein [Aestuariicella hydrocarbonica]
MCLILFALRAHPDYPLIVAANRDEYFQRPTLAADYWPDQADLLAGRDLQAGGTWLGVNQQGQFAAVTNVRNGLDTQVRPGSRGELVANCLTHPDTLGQLRKIAAKHAHYNGFNLLAGTPERLFYSSNRNHSVTAGPPAATTELPGGVHGLSNGGLNSRWPKVDSGKALLADLLARDWSRLDERKVDLLALLADDTQAPTEQLPDTGISPDKEAILSSRFIACPAGDPHRHPMPDYGTRASTLVLFHRSGHIHFVERSFSLAGTRFRQEDENLNPANNNRNDELTQSGSPPPLQQQTREFVISPARHRTGQPN